MTLIGLLFLNSAIAQIPIEKTLLWKISGKGLSQPSYLFGTIHLMCPNEIKIHKVIKDKFEQTKSLYMEIDLTDPSMASKAMKLMQMQDSNKLTKLLGNKYDTVNQMFQSMAGFSMTLMNTIKPMLILSAILPALLGCQPVSWESIFQKMALEKHMEIRGLETIKDQMDIFDSIPYQEQADILTKTILNKDSTKAELKNMLLVYAKKDIEQMNMLTIMDDGLKKFENILLTRRNENWIPIIIRQIKINPTFFAFGAGHLGGENGVIHLLRKDGYKVKPVMY